ncbi:hypothetical protein [Paenibacillus hamazuiensis]|uniref:hypothetical protein n=1 Tax=Paenibacillus hamazuiensis TaxID=2936508 RepID=UPI00200DFCA4|nr:hypothetical protein [Paenibacillus hamazuiensis]
MAKLEYRLFEGGDAFPLLYYYEQIAEEEIAVRFVCDYFVKDKTVYEKTSAAAETDCFVIYVKKAEDEYALEEAPGGPANGVCIELREYREPEELHARADGYRLVSRYEFPDNRAALLHMMSDYLYADGIEWSKTSAEIDEDRKVYVIYAKPAE